MASNLDDEFGGFEEAPSILNIPTKNETINQIPNWLLPQQSNQTIKQLQDELNSTKQQLLEQQIKHRQQIAEFQKALFQQRDNFKQLLEQYKTEQDLKINELQRRQDINLKEQIEDKIVELQEKLISHYQSDSDDLRVKINKMVKEEHLAQKDTIKQYLEQIEKDLRSETETSVQNFFKNQSEFFKEQIKSGMLQEHLIHKDLINNKLEKLFKSSEEKRRNSNMLFTRHLSGLNFFIENAHKQLSVLNEAHLDMLKNRDTIDYYGASALTATTTASEPLSVSSTASNDLLFLFGSPKNSNNKAEAGENYKLIDEDLLQDLA